jgi:hypothetical protein
MASGGLRSRDALLGSRVAGTVSHFPEHLIHVPGTFVAFHFLVLSRLQGEQRVVFRVKELPQ